MLRRLIPSVDRLCSMAEEAGASTPATPSPISVLLKPITKAVVAVDAAHQALRDAPQRDQFEQAVCRDSDVRDLAGNGRSVADGDADIRRGQGRRVVDAVADHDDRAPRCTLGFDKTRLSSGNTSAR